jgi:hypothetical protein
MVAFLFGKIKMEEMVYTLCFCGTIWTGALPAQVTMDERRVEVAAIGLVALTEEILMENMHKWKILGGGTAA